MIVCRYISRRIPPYTHTNTITYRFLHMLVHFLIIPFLFGKVFTQSYNDIICRRPWYFNSPRPAPLRCPTPSFLTYYECCGEFMENCCWRFRPEPIYIFVISLIILFLVCCCCGIGWCLMGSRREKAESKEKEVQKKDEAIQTITESGDFEKRRSYAAARDREFNYQYFS